MSTTSIELRDVTTGYRSHGKDFRIGIHLTGQIQSGMLTILLGTNGAGKSTLLRSLSRSQPVLSGEIFLEGRSLNHFSRNELARTVGVVLTEREHYGDNLTTEETIALGRTPYTGFWDKPSAQDKAIIGEAQQKTGIRALSQRRLYTLSDGERQKVMIAKALAQQTPIILLDEPTAFLDFPSKLEIFRTLSQLAHEDGKTIVLSTHSVTLALQMADMLWVMKAGETATIGTPHELSECGALDFLFEKSGAQFDRKSMTYRLDSFDKDVTPLKDVR